MVGDIEERWSIKNGRVIGRARNHYLNYFLKIESQMGYLKVARFKVLPSSPDVDFIFIKLSVTCLW